MEESRILYYASQFLQPEPVVVLIYNRTVHLHQPVTNNLVAKFPLKEAVHERNESVHRLYFDEGKRQYIEIPAGHTLLVTLSKELPDARLSFGGRIIKNRLILYTSILVAVMAGTYFAILSFIPWMGAKIISKESEISIGNQMMDLMMKGETIDTIATGKLRSFGQMLTLSKEYPIRLTVVRGETVNAFALPGGNVVVYTGLLKKIRTPEELAALLSHESMHVNQRHTLKSLLRKVTNSIIISVIFGDASGIAGALLGNADAIAGLSYSRSLESEADEEGMQLLLKNDVGPEGMRQLMTTLQNEEKGHPEAYSFLSSHPLTKDRLKAADSFLKEHSIALCEAWEEGKISEGDLICLAAFGSGFTWGSALLRW